MLVLLEHRRFEGVKIATEKAGKYHVAGRETCDSGPNH